MSRNLAMALALSAVLGGMLWIVWRNSASTGNEGASGDHGGENSARRGSTAPSAQQRARAIEQLGQIAETSHGLMPEGYEALYISMPFDHLQRLRPNIRRERGALGQRDDGQEVWAEDDPGGARVVYLVSAGGQLLTQVQFMSRLDRAEELDPHFRALQQRYGQPTGVWNCPETPTASPMRRFTWRREGASLMEAILIHGSSIAVTLVVAATGDVGAAVQRAQCQPARNAQEIANFPVAQQLRGTQETFVRELHRDGGR